MEMWPQHPQQEVKEDPAVTSLFHSPHRPRRYLWALGKGSPAAVLRRPAREVLCGWPPAGRSWVWEAGFSCSREGRRCLQRSFQKGFGGFFKCGLKQERNGPGDHEQPDTEAVCFGATAVAEK